MIVHFIYLAIILVILLYLRRAIRLGDFYHQKWAEFEGKYWSLYEAYIKRLTPDELARVQDISINRDREAWQIQPQLKEPI